MRAPRSQEDDPWRGLAKRLGVTSIPARYRELLEPYFEDWEAYNDAGREELIDDAATMFRKLQRFDSKIEEEDHGETGRPALEDYRPAPGRRPDGSYSELGEYEVWRSEAFSSFIAAQAEKCQEVQRVRRLVLNAVGGQFSSEDDQTLRDVMDLTHAYPWTVEQTLVFLATGEPPFISPTERTITLTSRQACDFGRITMVVDPEVSVEVVQNVFLEAKRLLLGNRGNRGPSLLSLKLYRYARELMRTGRWRDWADFVEQWNKQFPGETRLKSPEDCARTFRRIEKVLAVRYDWDALKRDAEPEAGEVEPVTDYDPFE